MRIATKTTAVDVLIARGIGVTERMRRAFSDPEYRESLREHASLRGALTLSDLCGLSHQRHLHSKVEAT